MLASQPHLEIRAVGPEFAEVAVALLQEASQWLAYRGLHGWSKTELQNTDFAAHAASGELVLGFVDDRAAACMLLQRIDPVYWPRARPGTALYIHKLAVARVNAGNRWSARMFRWAKEQAQQRGIKRLRLDTRADSPLTALYTQYGFRVVDRWPRVVEGKTMVRMQCTLDASARFDDLVDPGVCTYARGSGRGVCA